MDMVEFLLCQVRIQTRVKTKLLMMNPKTFESYFESSINSHFDTVIIRKDTFFCSAEV
jgi:hypothetical protein